MIKITRESCRAAGACYDDDRIDELIPPDGLTPREVADLADVPYRDRSWALIHAAGASDRTLRLASCRSARRALSRVVDPDPRSVAIVDVAERYARGEATDEELGDACEAARDAARRTAFCATAYAARVATYTAVAAPATAAYAAAARVAVYAAAARVAVYAAAARVAVYAADDYDAEWEVHLTDLVELLQAQDDQHK